MTQTEYIGEGALQQCAAILKDINPQKIFLVVGPGSYAASGAKAYFTQALAGLSVLEYNDFHALLTEEDVQKGVEACRQFNPDLVVAVGGGHVLDAAKAINFLSGKKPVIAIPTTAGSGAEATPFAVIYKNGLKTSLEDPQLLPAYTIIDPVLCRSVPQQVAVASGLDALCQSIESFWSRQATEESRGYSREALGLVWKSLLPALIQKDVQAQSDLAHGAHVAGKAIAIAKTTACHAFSYGLTYRFGVPHGIAVALFLPAMMRFNGAELPEGVTAERVEELLAQFDVRNLRQFGVAEADLASLKAEVDIDRLSNNPRTLTSEDIHSIYKSIL